MTKAFTYDARAFFREAGFPFSRLHDVEYPYGSGEFVDIPCVFKNFDADRSYEKIYEASACDALELQLNIAENTVVYIGTIIDDTEKKINKKSTLAYLR